MNMKEQLSSLGWSVKTEFFEGNKGRIDDVKKQLLDTDLRQSGEKSLPETTKLDQTTKAYIVQLHKTRNVTAPKDNETSSHKQHLYRLIITDGHVFQNALVLPSLRNFNLDTPPGIKILLKPKTKVSNGFYLLNDQTCEILGGTVNELVQKWKLNKLMGKHVRTLIGEGAPPPWVPFGTKDPSATAVDTSQRSMDVAKMQQNNEEDPEFVRQRRAAINTLLTDQVSKTQRFATQDVIRGKNLAKGFEQASQKMPIERPNTASTSSSSVSNKPTNIVAAAAAIKANSRLPEWAKNQIADEPTEEDKRRPQSDRKQPSRRNFDDDDDDRPKRGGGFGRNRRGRGRGGDDDGGEETRPSKDVTLFDFFAAKSKSTTQKAASTSKTQKIDTIPTQGASASNQPRVSSAIQKQIFEYENGDQVLARYYEDNEYYPAVVMNIMHDTQKCAVMFEGYDSQELVSFDDIEPFEDGYYNEEEEEYEQEQLPPPPPQSSSSSQRNNSAAQYQQPLQQRNQPAYQQDQSGYGYYNQQPQQQQQRNQPVYQQDQSGYDYYNQQQQQRDNQNRNRPNSGRGYPQQQYPNRYNNNNY